MAVKIIISRREAKAKEEELLPLLIKLRALAASQPGYISGETWRNLEDPEETLVISTWKSVDDWEAWAASKQRVEIQEGIDALLGEKTTYGKYLYG